MEKRGDREECDQFGESAAEMERQRPGRVEEGRRPSSTGLYS